MLYSLLRVLVRGFTNLIFFVQVYGRENMPREGAAILAVNHTSMWDPPVLVSHLARPPRIMAKKELFSNKLIGGFLRFCGAFPVNRGQNDITAIKTALKTLKNGDTFMIFPSGTRVKADEAADAKAGVALIANRSGAPVIPVAIRGRYRLFSPIRIYIGKPVYVGGNPPQKLSGDDLKEAAGDIMREIEKLGV